MATNFPTSADDGTTLPNPNGTDHTNSPDHASLHGNANDAIKAIEAKVGTGSSTPTNNTLLRGNGAGTSTWSGLTSAQLLAILTDETGTGSAVFATTPTLVTPKVDTINESTPTNGVTIDGLNIKDSALNTNNSVVTANITDGAVTPAKLLAGTGSTWVWQSWTPTWTNVTIGNATVVGKYNQIGKTIIAKLSVVWGNTTSASGNIIFTLPVTASSQGGTVNVAYIGYGTAYDVSGAIVYDTNLTMPSTSTAGVISKAANGTWVTNSAVSNASPVTWANTDEWNWTLIYQAA